MSTTSFSDEQRQQIIEWLASGDSDRAIQERIDRENTRGTGKAPWPRLVPGDLRRFRDATKVAIARVADERLGDVLLQGLAERGRTLTFISSQVEAVSLIASDLFGKLRDLIDQGAFDFTALGVNAPATDDPSIIEAELVGQGRVPAIVAEAKALGFDPREVYIRDRLLERAEAAGKLAGTLLREQNAMLLTLTRIAGTIDGSSPMDYQGKREKARNIAEALRGRAARQAQADPDTDDDDGEDAPIDPDEET